MELAISPRGTTGIKDLALACERLLWKISQDDGDHDKTDISTAQVDWASRLYAEFNVWSTRVGVNSDGIRSIDNRLINVPEIYSLLKHLLQSLERDLSGSVPPPYQLHT